MHPNKVFNKLKQIPKSSLVTFSTALIAVCGCSKSDPSQQSENSRSKDNSPLKSQTQTAEVSPNYSTVTPSNLNETTTQYVQLPIPAAIKTNIDNISVFIKLDKAYQAQPQLATIPWVSLTNEIYVSSAGSVYLFANQGVPFALETFTGEFSSQKHNVEYERADLTYSVQQENGEMQSYRHPILIEELTRTNGALGGQVQVTNTVKNDAIFFAAASKEHSTVGVGYLYRFIHLVEKDEFFDYSQKDNHGFNQPIWRYSLKRKQTGTLETKADGNENDQNQQQSTSGTIADKALRGRYGAQPRSTKSQTGTGNATQSKSEFPSNMSEYEARSKSRVLDIEYIQSQLKPFTPIDVSESFRRASEKDIEQLRELRKAVESTKETQLSRSLLPATDLIDGLNFSLNKAVEVCKHHKLKNVSINLIDRELWENLATQGKEKSVIDNNVHPKARINNGYSSSLNDLERSGIRFLIIASDVEASECCGVDSNGVDFFERRVVLEATVAREGGNPTDSNMSSELRKRYGLAAASKPEWLFFSANGACIKHKDALVGRKLDSLKQGSVDQLTSKLGSLVARYSAEGLSIPTSMFLMNTPSAGSQQWKNGSFVSMFRGYPYTIDFIWMEEGASKIKIELVDQSASSSDVNTFYGQVENNQITLRKGAKTLVMEKK